MENSPNRTLSVPALIGALRRHFLYLLIPAVVLAAAAWVVARRMPQNYKARVEIAAEPVAPANYLSGRPAIPPEVNVQDHLRSIRDDMLSPAALKLVAGEAGIGELQGSIERAVEDLKSKIQIQVESTDAFFVSLEGPKPEQTMNAANYLAENFVNGQRAQMGARTEQVDTFLDQQVADLRKQLDQQEGGLSGYKERVSQALPDRVATSLNRVRSIQDQIQNESDHIAEAQARRTAIVEELKTMDAEHALTPEPVAKTPTELALDDARIKLRQLEARYTPQTSLVIEAQKNVKALESAAANEKKAPRPPSENQMKYIGLQAELKQVDERVKSYGRQRDALQAQLDQAQKQVDTAPGYEGEIDRLSKDAAVTRARYEALLQRQQEAKLDQKAGQGANGILYKIIEPASLPTSPAGPKRYQIVLIGLIAGLGLGFVAVLAREQMDSSFGTVEEFEGFAKLPVLAAVPTISGRTLRMRPRVSGIGSGPRPFTVHQNGDGITLDQKHLMKHRLTVMSDPHSVPSEQYRILMLKVLQWLAKDARDRSLFDGGKMLVVTSAAGGEGKSVTAVNLSLALAGAIRGPVLLVDADLWRPRVSQYLGLGSQPGISDLLASEDGDGDAMSESCIAKVANLDVLAGGTRLEDPVGLLSSPRARQALKQLQEKYRLIVIDSPPIVPAADSHLLAELADGVLVVVRARQTKRELFRRALDSLGAKNVLGVVLNDVNFGDTSYAYAYRYYQRECVGRR